jgi:uncharacterized protein
MPNRVYENPCKNDLIKREKLLFLAGPRQVGKTFLSRLIASNIPHQAIHYLTWDEKEQRALILKGAIKLAAHLKLDAPSENKPIIIFDEIHKYRGWKNFLKGFYDHYAKDCRIIVTGSSRLDVFRKGGDSLMGRYLLYRIHPLTVGEIVNPERNGKEMIQAPTQISPEVIQNLLTHGGFPEPYYAQDKLFTNQWHRLREQLLFHEDIRSLSQIQEVAQLELLADLLKEQVGQLTNMSNLANKINVSVPTIKRWLKTLETFYYCFAVKPYSRNITRSLIKEPKFYLWDWSLVTDPGQRLENFVASHLLKAVHYWTDRGYGEYELYFLRDKEGNETDFMVTENRKPWFLVEVKSSDHQALSSALTRFQNQTGAKHAFQAILEADFKNINCYDYDKPVKVPLATLLSQWV